jgi:hypothetical protein
MDTDAGCSLPPGACPVPRRGYSSGDVGNTNFFRRTARTLQPAAVAARTRRLVAAPSRCRTLARVVTLALSACFAAFGIGVYRMRYAAVLEQLTSRAVGDLICGRFDETAGRSESAYRKCMHEWVERLAGDASGTTEGDFGARLLESESDGTLVLPWLVSGNVWPSSFGLVFVVLGLLMFATLSLRGKRWLRMGTKCVQLAVAAALLALLCFTLPIFLVLAAIRPVGGLQAEKSSAFISDFVVGLGGNETVWIDSLNLSSSIVVKRTGVEFPHLASISPLSLEAAKAGAAFEIPLEFVMKEVYYQLAALLAEDSQADYERSNPETAISNFTSTDDGSPGSNETGTTMALRMHGMVWSAAVQWIVPHNLSLLCAFEDSLSCRGWHTGDCPDASTRCHENAL